MEPLARRATAENPHAGWFPDRRSFLRAAGFAGMSWLTPVSQLLAQAAEQGPRGEPAQSIILIWLAGGPSQLETFDPHPGTMSAGGTRAVATAVKGIELAEGFGRLAEQMNNIALVRSMVSKEGDHERGTYVMKTGYRPDPTVVHPSIGAVCCHELPVGKTEIPRHISILPSQWPGLGGFLGDEYNAFKTGDPAQKVPDLTAQVPMLRDRRRLEDLDVVEQAFARGRRERVDATLHRATVAQARTMMTSEQLKAFDVMLEPARLRASYGDTAFGRGCLAARRLLQVGVRCVEVTLSGWDSHINNHAIVRNLLTTLDPAFSTLIRDLAEHGLLRKTIVLCAGEFGRTPTINPQGGRDHWPTGFSLALAGGMLRTGQAIGKTDPEGKKDPVDPVTIADVHATMLTALGIDPRKLVASPIGRTLKLSEGQPIRALLG
ncbi:MAG TPA: DUF1501 domain-containing protein [Gemmataceae bacterium]|nr:DUF1501 domain-containing protein [Gemmataceae bacterium]